MKSVSFSTLPFLGDLPFKTSLAIFTHLALYSLYFRRAVKCNILSHVHIDWHVTTNGSSSQIFSNSMYEQVLLDQRQQLMWGSEGS